MFSVFTVFHIWCLVFTATWELPLFYKEIAGHFYPGLPFWPPNIPGHSSFHTEETLHVCFEYVMFKRYNEMGCR